MSLRLEAGSEQFKTFLRAMWLRAAKSQIALSIECSDRTYLRQALYNERREMDGDWSKFHVVFPEQGNELWIVKKQG